MAQQKGQFSCKDIIKFWKKVAKIFTTFTLNAKYNSRGIRVFRLAWKIDLYDFRFLITYLKSLFIVCVEADPDINQNQL